MLYWLLFNKTSSCITSSSTCYHEWLWLVISIECWYCLFQNEDFYHGKEIARSWCCRNLKFFVMMNWSLIGKWDPHLGFVMYKLMWSFKTAQTQFERPLLWPYFHLSWHWQRASSVAGEWLVFKFFKYIEVLHESLFVWHVMTMLIKQSSHCNHFIGLMRKHILKNSMKYQYFGQDWIHKLKFYPIE